MKWTHAIGGWALALFVAGCAHYGYVDDVSAAQASAGAPALGVSTVAVAADQGMNGARLTRALVDSIARHGLAARWGSTGSTRLACAVASARVDGFEQALFASASVRCNLVRDAQVVERFEAVGHFTTSARVDDPASLSGAHAAIQEAAALDAFDAIAADLAHWSRHQRR